MRPLLLLIAGGLLVGCLDPTTEALVGHWTNDDDSAREILFDEDDAGAFTYAVSVDDETLQTGTYAVMDDTLVNVDGEEQTLDNVLVWTVQFEASGAVQPGSQFGDPIYSFTNTRMVLRSGSAQSGRRTWLREE